MKAVKHALLFILLFSGLMLSSLSVAYAHPCSCVADVFSKQYQHISYHWWGSRRAWTCDYHCQTPYGPVKITGKHKSWYHGKDDGREGVCDGVPFKNQYNVHIADFIWIPQAPEGFNPLKSSADNLRTWAQAICH